MFYIYNCIEDKMVHLFHKTLYVKKIFEYLKDTNNSEIFLYFQRIKYNYFQ